MKVTWIEQSTLNTQLIRFFPNLAEPEPKNLTQRRKGAKIFKSFPFSVLGGLGSAAAWA